MMTSKPLYACTLTAYVVIAFSFLVLIPLVSSFINYWDQSVRTIPRADYI